MLVRYFIRRLKIYLTCLNCIIRAIIDKWFKILKEELKFIIKNDTFDNKIKWITITSVNRLLIWPKCSMMSNQIIIQTAGSNRNSSKNITTLAAHYGRSVNFQSIHLNIEEDNPSLCCILVILHWWKLQN